jgi:hypothetical protein
MITWLEVLKLRKAIPPRYPRGSPENYKRIGPERTFMAALRQYEREHGRSWFDDKPAQRLMLI